MPRALLASHQRALLALHQRALASKASTQSYPTLHRTPPPPPLLTPLCSPPPPLLALSPILIPPPRPPHKTTCICTLTCRRKTFPVLFHLSTRTLALAPSSRTLSPSHLAHSSHTRAFHQPIQKTLQAPGPYDHTLCLPRTDFPMRADAARREPSIQANCFTGLYDWQAARPGPLYILHDGPPFANGRPHMGHAVNKVPFSSPPPLPLPFLLSFSWQFLFPRFCTLVFASGPTHSYGDSAASTLHVYLLKHNCWFAW